MTMSSNRCLAKSVRSGLWYLFASSRNTISRRPLPAASVKITALSTMGGRTFREPMLLCFSTARLAGVIGRPPMAYSPVAVPISRSDAEAIQVRLPP